MHNSYRTVTGLIGALILVSCLQAGLAQVTFDPETMMRAEDVERGMEGVGKSVFQGVEVEDFQFQVIGRMKKLILGEDLILARITGGPPIERNAGIIGGMSGSPCYVDDRLVGALAYGWSWQKEALFGITPIEAMIEGTWPKEAAPKQASGRRYEAAEPIQLAGRSITGAVVGTGGAFADDHTIILQPAMPQITCTGFSDRAMELMGKFLEPHGLQAEAGPGTLDEPVPVELQPGSAVGVRLMTGDFESAATGTMTYRNGDRVLAFGHPMMEMGPARLPFCSAYVHDIIPSIQRSGKIGSPMEDVGTLFSDNPWAVGAEIGETPEMVPASFSITDSSRDVKKNFNVQVCDQPLITSQLISMAMMSAVEASFNPDYEGIATLHFIVKGAQGDTVERTETFYYQSSVMMNLMSSVMFPMYLLQENRFRPQGIESVQVDAEFTRTDDTALIERVFTEETAARAGEKLNLHIITRPDGEQEREQVVSLDIPIDTPKGAMRLAVCNGGDAWTIRSRLHLLEPSFNDLQSVIDFFEDMERNDQLAVIGALPSTGLLVGDTTLWRLPASYENLVKSSPRTDLRGGRSELSNILDSKYVLYGAEYLGIPTVNRQGAKGASPKPPTPDRGEEKITGGFLPPGAVVPIAQGWAADAFAHNIATAMKVHFGLDEPREMVDLPPGLKMLLEDEEDEDDEKEEEEKEEAEEEEEEKKPSEEKMVVRQPEVWAQSEADQFLEGKSEGIAVRSDGVVTLAPHVSEVDFPAEFYVVSSAVDDAGTAYFGTGTNGQIYATSDESVKLYAETDRFMVTALLFDDGKLLAATAPGGVILGVGEKGDTEELWDLPVDYVWSIGRSASGELLACTGSSGKVYTLEEDGEYSELIAVSQAHVLCMTADDTYTYFGSASEGVVYRASADGSYTALFDRKDEDITDLVIGPSGSEYEGDLFVAAGKNGSTGEGGVYRITPDGSIETLYEEKKSAVYSLGWVNGELYAGTGDEGKLLAITDKNRYSSVYDSEDESITCLQPVGDDRMYAATSNLATLTLLDAGVPTSGWLESSVLDGKRRTQWGRIIWQAQTSGAASAVLQTRSGNNSDPSDDSWTEWSPPLSVGETGATVSPGSRYLQYRLKLERQKAADTADVSMVRIAYLSANRAPEVEFDEPEEGAVLSAEVEIEWDADDDDDDSLLSTLRMRPAGDEDWQTLQEPAVDKDSYKWDTRKTDDGRYEMQIEVSDKPSSPDDPLSAKAALELLTVDNSVPSLWAWDVVAEDDELVIRGVAADTVSRIVQVTYRLDDTWMGATPDDGMYDSPYEIFQIRLPLPEDETEISVRVRDAGGNENEMTITWPNTTGGPAMG